MIIFTPNTVIKSADINSNFDNLDKGLIHNPYKFGAYRSTSQGGGTIIFANEYFDTNDNYNTSTGIYTCPVTGYYQFNATTSQPVTAAPQDPSMTIFKNAGGVVNSHFVNMYNGVSTGSAVASTFIYCLVGDQIYVWSARGCDNANAAGNTFNGYLVSL